MSGTRRTAALVALASTAFLVAACTEAPQTNKPQRKADATAFSGADPAYTAEGWKAGDKASWEQQIKGRNQGQNDYSR